MSLRSQRKKPNAEVERLRADLDEMKRAAAQADNAVDVGACVADSTAEHEFDKLSPVEQSAASLGVAPGSFKPIEFLNNGHYKQLISANLLDDNLARRIEAYRVVSES